MVREVIARQLTRAGPLQLLFFLGAYGAYAHHLVGANLMNPFLEFDMRGRVKYLKRSGFR
jgi:hypothetical protein